MSRKISVSVALSVLALLTLAHNKVANAAEEVTVQAKIVPSCVVAASTLDFGNLSTTQNNTGSTSIGLSQCGSLTAVDISLNTGDNPSANGTRQINNGTDNIAYSLSDTGGTAITGTSEHEVSINGGNGSFAVNGLIDPGEVANKSGGDYLDKLDVTVDFAS